MSKITKAQARKRLNETVIKLRKVSLSGHLTPTQDRKLYEIALKIHEMANKLK
jgi:hypothetical protein